MYLISIYLDLVFDCHEIDKLDAIEDNSIEVIPLTNVLHHLISPIEFLNRAASKLKSAGKVIATKRFFSVLSTAISKYLHHEPVDFGISEPQLAEVQGATGVVEHRITVAKILPAARMAVTIEREFRYCDLFDAPL
jgi:hypothetical protein